MTEGYRAPKLTLPVGDRDHVQGPADAPMVLVEYGDYQCPYCGAAYPIVKRVQQELGTSLKFVFRNFPITNAHPRAEWAAETAEAVGAHGKFWEIHDFLFENQRSLRDEAFFAKYISQLGLDPKVILSEVANQVYGPRIEEDFRSGVRSGVNGTPTFFIGGARYDGYPEFSPLVAALKASQSTRRPKG